MPVTRSGIEYSPKAAPQSQQSAETVAAPAKVTSSLASNGQHPVASLISSVVAGILFAGMSPRYSPVTDNTFEAATITIASLLMLQLPTENPYAAAFRGAAVGLTCVAVNKLFQTYFYSSTSC